VLESPHLHPLDAELALEFLQPTPSQYRLACANGIRTVGDLHGKKQGFPKTLRPLRDRLTALLRKPAQDGRLDLRALILDKKTPVYFARYRHPELQKFHALGGPASRWITSRHLTRTLKGTTTLSDLIYALDSGDLAKHVSGDPPVGSVVRLAALMSEVLDEPTSTTQALAFANAHLGHSSAPFLYPLPSAPRRDLLLKLPAIIRGAFSFRCSGLNAVLLDRLTLPPKDRKGTDKLSARELGRRNHRSGARAAFCAQQLRMRIFEAVHHGHCTGLQLRNSAPLRSIFQETRTELSKAPHACWELGRLLSWLAHHWNVPFRFISDYQELILAALGGHAFNAELRWREFISLVVFPVPPDSLERSYVQSLRLRLHAISTALAGREMIQSELLTAASRECINDGGSEISVLDLQWAAHVCPRLAPDDLGIYGSPPDTQSPGDIAIAYLQKHSRPMLAFDVITHVLTRLKRDTSSSEERQKISALIRQKAQIVPGPKYGYLALREWNCPPREKTESNPRMKRIAQIEAALLKANKLLTTAELRHLCPTKFGKPVALAVLRQSLKDERFARFARGVYGMRSWAQTVKPNGRGYFTPRPEFLNGDR
jgi:hypothetical protein